LSLPHVPARRGVSGGRVGHVSGRAVSDRARDAIFVPFIATRAPTFCAACGSPLTYEHSDSSGFIDITTCSFDVPDAFPPTHHSWLSHDVAWVKFGDGLPAYQQSKT
jgi:hypothetical protein